MRHPFTTRFKGLERFFKDPVLAEEFVQVMGSFQQQVEEGFTRVSAGANLSIALPSTATDQEDVEVSLQELLAPLETDGKLQLIPPGVVVGFDGTWEEAKALKGWDIHTPLLGVFPKWVTEGEDAGTTGGAEAHTHDDHTADEVADALEDHPNHAHTVGPFDTTDNVPTQHGVQSGVTFLNIAETHNHEVDDVTGQGGGNPHVGDDPDPLEHSVEGNDPLFYKLIPIIKL